MRLFEISDVTVLPGSQMYQQWHHDKKMFDRIKYLHPREMTNEIHFFIHDQNKIVADAGIQQSPYDENQIWLKHVAVAEKYQQRGLASKLLDAVFQYCLKHNKVLQMSSYSDMGQQYLPNTIERLRQKYPDVTVRAASDY